MATNVQVTPEQKAASAATNIRVQFLAMQTQGQGVNVALQNPPAGVTPQQLQAALGADYATITAAIAPFI